MVSEQNPPSEHLQDRIDGVRFQEATRGTQTHLNPAVTNFIIISYCQQIQVPQGPHQSTCSCQLILNRWWGMQSLLPE